METQSPFSLLGGLLARLPATLSALPPVPPWLVHEVQHRTVLLLNHVLQQEPEAMDRLARQRGRVAEVHWRHYSLALRATPAGLLNLVEGATIPDLRIELTETSPLALAAVALRGEKPPIRIEGDVQLAAEINWLVDHVQWDLEEDLARLVGDAPAHAMAQAGRRAAQALRAFVGARMASAMAGAVGGGIVPTTASGAAFSPGPDRSVP